MGTGTIRPSVAPADQAELLELAGARGDGAGFRVEVGVPHELVKSLLQRCVDRQQRRAIERAARAQP